ncbi:hypothetical protein E2C01_012169 [Portunus trituberculatus]|uniref:Uncharacterized protein n=1 Tax=Portunus trituberculatus TaxID=210409 RepID=A0A5B7DDF7_PORTR|nr:hypothetical protein [Portunus trituberculatus]
MPWLQDASLESFPSVRLSGCPGESLPGCDSLRGTLEGVVDVKKSICCGDKGVWRLTFILPSDLTTNSLCLCRVYPQDIFETSIKQLAIILQKLMWGIKIVKTVAINLVTNIEPA